MTHPFKASLLIHTSLACLLTAVTLEASNVGEKGEEGDAGTPVAAVPLTDDAAAAATAVVTPAVTGDTTAEGTTPAADAATAVVTPSTVVAVSTEAAVGSLWNPLNFIPAAAGAFYDAAAGTASATYNAVTWTAETAWAGTTWTTYWGARGVLAVGTLGGTEVYWWYTAEGAQATADALVDAGATGEQLAQMAQGAPKELSGALMDASKLADPDAPGITPAQADAIVEAHAAEGVEPSANGTSDTQLDAPHGSAEAGSPASVAALPEADDSLTSAPANTPVATDTTEPLSYARVNGSQVRIGDKTYKILGIKGQLMYVDQGGSTHVLFNLAGVTLEKGAFLWFTQGDAGTVSVWKGPQDGEKTSVGTFTLPHLSTLESGTQK